MNFTDSQLNDGTKYKVNLSLTQHNDVRVIAYNLIEPLSKVLDVGCACGDFGALLTAKTSDIYGMDYNRLSLEDAQSKKMYKKLHQVDLNTFKTKEYPEYFEFFDYITLLDVLEHTIEPLESLERLKPYLKKNGHFIVSLPNVSFGDVKISLLKDEFNYSDTGILDRTHIRFFTWKTISSFFVDARLEVFECHVKVADIKDVHKVPFWTSLFIKSNPHSYVYQYVIKSHLISSDLDDETLLSINQKKMSLQFTDIKKQLKAIRRLSFFNHILPVGSRFRLVAKNIKKILYKGEF